MPELRTATADDVPALTVLLREYMRELFRADWSGSPAALARDGLGLHFETMVALRDGEPIGFAAWKRSYDLHHCVAGGEIMDLYLRPGARGRGVVLELVAAVAAAVRARGGVYITGLAVGEPTTRRLYERVAITFEGAHCIVGGRAFRVLADLAGQPARAIVKGLPNRASNAEP